MDNTPEEMVTKMASWSKTLGWFNDRMWDKMLMNKHKSGWHGMSLDYLRFRLGQELVELDEALASDTPPENIIDECADIANFAAMIADVARKGN